MERSQIRDFTQGNITNQLVEFAMPLFFANLLQVVYNMVDMIVVGQVLGKAGTSAVSVGGDITSLLTFVAMGFANSGQILIARYIGLQRRDRIGRFVGTMCGFLITCAIVISITASFFQDSLLHMMNTPAESYEGASDYARICMSGLIFIYGYNMVSAILRGMGDSRHPFLFIGISTCTNVVLDLFFILGLGMGAGGAALATVISQAVSFISCTIFLIRHRVQFCLNIGWRELLQWDSHMLGELVRLGIPMALSGAAIMSSKLFVNSWINSYGVAVSAFAGIAAKITSVSNLVSQAMNTAGSTMISQNLAAERFDRVKAILRRIAVITLSLALFFSVIILLRGELVFRAFTQDAAVLALVHGYIPIAILCFFGGGLRAVANALINGSARPKINFITAIFDGVILRIGYSLLFGLALGMKHYGFWLGDALAGYTPFLAGTIFFLSGSWMKKRPEKGEA